MRLKRGIDAGGIGTSEPDGRGFVEAMWFEVKAKVPASYPQLRY
jgi:hypothetical protein